MRILLVADLHSNIGWYEWLVSQATLYDLVSIAGDLTDAFAPDEQGQIEYLLHRWLPAFLKTGVPLAICSGNHDDPAIPWGAVGEGGGVVVSDCETRLLTLPSGRRLVVTTSPFDRRKRQWLIENLWQEGVRLRDQEHAPWLVLHHEPPREISPPGVLANYWVRSKIMQYGPDLVTCGHFHDTDELPFAVKLGDALCFNSGQDPRSPRPHHIVLDLAAGTATRQRMIPVRGTLSWITKADTIAL